MSKYIQWSINYGRLQAVGGSAVLGDGEVVHSTSKLTRRVGPLVVVLVVDGDGDGGGWFVGMTCWLTVWPLWVGE